MSLSKILFKNVKLMQKKTLKRASFVLLKIFFVLAVCITVNCKCNIVQYKKVLKNDRKYCRIVIENGEKPAVQNSVQSPFTGHLKPLFKFQVTIVVQIEFLFHPKVHTL